MIGFEAILYYLFLLDCVIANIVVWTSPKILKWYKKKHPVLQKHLPLTKPWAFIYLILVIWIGLALYRLGLVF